MKINLNKGYILIEITNNKTTDSGLVIAGQRSETGKVISVGKGCEQYQDKDIYFIQAVKEITLDDKKYLIVHKKQIVAWL